MSARFFILVIVSIDYSWYYHKHIKYREYFWGELALSKIKVNSKAGDDHELA